MFRKLAVAAAAVLALSACGRRTVIVPAQAVAVAPGPVVLAPRPVVVAPVYGYHPYVRSYAYARPYGYARSYARPYGYGARTVVVHHYHY